MLTIMKPTPLDIQLHVYVCNIDFNSKSITHFPWLTSSLPLYCSWRRWSRPYFESTDKKQHVAQHFVIFFSLFYFMRQRCSLGYLSSARPSPPLLPCAVRVNSQRHLCSFPCATVAPHYVFLGPSFSPGHLSRSLNNPQSFKVKRVIVHGW